MATVYEIVQGLSQAAANAYDGAHNDDGELVEVGLRREEGDPILDKRVMDGFNVRFTGNMMCLTYQSEIQLKEVYAKGFENEINQRLADITSFLKKEYRKINGESVQLTLEGEVDISAESVSRHRSWVMARQHYKIGGIDKEQRIDEESKDRLDSGWKSFLELGGWDGSGGKRPKNDKRPKNSGE